MLPAFPSRRRTMVAVSALALAVGPVGPVTTAGAAAEAAPEPTEYEVVAGVHADVVSTYLDEGELVLGSTVLLGDEDEQTTPSKQARSTAERLRELASERGDDAGDPGQDDAAPEADVDRVRLDPHQIAFHVTDDARQTVPDDRRFLGPAGSQVWVVSEEAAEPGALRAGFSTMPVAAGAIEDDTTTLTLTEVEGPGDVEVFATAKDESVTRLWSSDDDHASFVLARTTQQASWAFTEPGVYRLHVAADVVVDDEPQAAEATYTFVVGDDVPAAQETAVTLTASETSVPAGDRVTLDATVEPAAADGWVEFVDASGDTGTLLGHAAVVDGAATWTTSHLGAGERPVVARFVPEVLNHHLPSRSRAATVTVTAPPEEGTSDGGADDDAAPDEADPSGTPDDAATAEPAEADEESGSPSTAPDDGDIGTDPSDPAVDGDALSASGGSDVAPSPTASPTTESPTEGVVPTGTDAVVHDLVDVEGVADRYRSGDLASLSVASPPPGAATYRWSTRPGAQDAWTEVPDAVEATYAFVVTGAQQVKVTVTDADGAVLAESAPFDVVMATVGSVGRPELEATLRDTEGALVVSVTPEGREATLDDLALNPAADRFESTGSLTGITVTDTRQANPGWSATGRVQSLDTTGGSTIAGRYLGWSPTVVGTSGGAPDDGPDVSPGPVVAPGLGHGDGIGTWRLLGSAEAGSSLGTAVLGADVRLEAPLTTRAGTYRGMVLLTVI